VPVTTAPATAAVPLTAVLAAGVGARHGRGLALRSVSFRLDAPVAGAPALGILAPGRAAAAAMTDLLAGAAAPRYGELRVLGQDMTTPGGRAAVRGRVGVVRRSGPVRPGLRVRGLVEHAATRTGLPRRDRRLLVAAILDRLELTPWAEVPVRRAPDPVARRARLAAAAVHQPDLLLIDRLLDDLAPRDAGVLAAAVRDISLDTCVVIAGTELDPLALTCGQVLTLEDGILVGG
jgi:ABC-2 type transport system ATP-binding protein